MDKKEKSIDELKIENEVLLKELQNSYENTLVLLEQSSKEKEIAYQELEKKYMALERLYKELSDKENMLIHLDKLSSIGQFIVEIIHELKNPLSVVSVNSELLLLADPPEDMKDKIERIAKSSDRMADYLDRFRRMIYKENENFRVFDLNENLTEFLDTIEIIKPKSMKIIVNMCTEKYQIKGDPYQLQQIFFNIAKNAFDAMKDHEQELSIDVQTVTSEALKNDSAISSCNCQSGKRWNVILGEYQRFVIIKFLDKGAGIADENLKDIFKAFYTSKSRGEGTGLGLSISSDIIRNHNGNIAVESSFGKGTAFRIILPVCDS